MMVVVAVARRQVDLSVHNIDPPAPDDDLAARLERAVLAGHGAVLVGEAGIGKSHRVRIVAERLRAAGAMVEFVLATRAASSVPFGALAALLEPASGTPQDVLEILRSTGQRLIRRAGGATFVLVVDDAHLLDPASAALLIALVGRHGIRVLATVRSGSAEPDAVTALWKDAGLVRLDLGPLPEAAAVRMMSDLLNGPLERETRRWIWETSAGNPLFVRELIRSGLDSGTLERRRGHWRRTQAIAPSERLLDLLGARVERLREDERRALALVVLGEPAPLSIIEALGALEPARALESRGLIAPAESNGPAALRVAHPLYGEAMRGALRTTETRVLHDELGAHLDPRDAATRLRLASWAVEDGVTQPASLLATAASDALEGFDPSLAIRLGEAARAAGGGIAAVMPLAAALRALGRFAEAEDRLVEVESEALSDPSPSRYLFLRATNLEWGLGRRDEARRLLAAAAAEPAVTAVAAALESSAGRLRAGADLAARVVNAPAHEDRLAVAIAGVVLGNALAVLGDPHGALAALDRVQRDAGGAESEWPRAAIAVVGAFFAAEQWSERRRALQGEHARARAAGDDARAALCELALVRLALPAGELATARRLAEDALARFVFADPRALAPTCHAAIAEAEALAGKPDAARVALDRAIAAARHTPVNALTREALLTATVLVRAAEGELADAQRLALTGAQAAAEAVLTEAELLHLFVRVGGDPGRVADRLQAIASRTGAGMAVLWARQASSAARSDGASLESVSSSYEQLGAHMYAAEAAAQAAIAFRSASADARRRAEGRAARIASHCGARGLTLLSTMRTPGLTSREQEVARLVARGLTNAQIAARLSLSVRTVESHIYRATTKLGIRDRTALSALTAGR